MTAQDLDALRRAVGERASVVCASFEKFGTGSDVDGSFERGGFFTGTMLHVEQSVYHELFGRKGLVSGLMTMSGEKIKESQKRKVGGNMLLGDGFQLGGMFVLVPTGVAGELPRVALDKRQGHFGDDAETDELEAALFGSGTA